MSLLHGNTVYEETGYVLITDVPVPEGLPEKLSYEGRLFHQKDEFHVTLFNIATLGFTADLVRKRRFLEAISRELQHYNVTTGEFLHPLYACEKDNGESRSIIAPLELLGIKELVLSLRSEFGAEISMPYPHVTLYTSGDERGIAVRDTRQLADRCAKADIPALEAKLYT